MIVRKIAAFIIVLTMVVSIRAQSLVVTIDSGTVLHKKQIDSDWNMVEPGKMVEINSGDSLMSLEDSRNVCTVSGNIRLLLKDSSKIAFSINNTITVLLISGQIFIDENDISDAQSLIVSARQCQFIPIGTAGAIKIIKDGDPTIAVLRGSFRLQKPDGETIDVASGFYCTYNNNGNRFEEIKPLPPQAIDALVAWSGVNYSVSADTPPPDDIAAAQTSLENKEDSTHEAAIESEDSLHEAAVTQQHTLQNTPSTAETVPKASATPKEDTVSDKKDSVQKQKTVSTESDMGSTKEQESASGMNKPTWEISAGNITVDQEQWTRLAFAVDVPFWRFGVCFDIELFLDSRGNFTDKGWNFDDRGTIAETLLRKIRYIRFNHENDPVFVKLGGIDNVTFGYGFIVDRFTNMLLYPDEKLLGLQFYLNDLGPIGLTMQTMIADFYDFGNDGGVVAGRIAVKPFKITQKKILSGLSIGALVAADLNQYAPARDWKEPDGPKWDKDEDGITDSAYLFQEYGDKIYYQTIVDDHKIKNDYDTKVGYEDVKSKEDRIVVCGADVVVPLISSQLLDLSVYGQVGVTLDEENDDKLYKGWGIGFPGVGVTVGPVWGRLEYRHIADQFEPGYFNTYYLRERLRKTPVVYTKEDSLPSVDLNGIFGEAGFNVFDFLTVRAAYQLLVGDEKTVTVLENDIPVGTKTVTVMDQRFEATGAIGSALLERIPKINKAEIFYYQTDIDNSDKYKRIFYQSPTTYWGYRIGAEITAGAFLVWETRYGWIWNNERTALLDDQTVTIQAGLKF